MLLPWAESAEPAVGEAYQRQCGARRRHIGASGFHLLVLVCWSSCFLLGASEVQVPTFNEWEDVGEQLVSRLQVLANSSQSLGTHIALELPRNASLSGLRKYPQPMEGPFLSGTLKLSGGNTSYAVLDCKMLPAISKPFNGAQLAVKDLSLLNLCSQTIQLRSGAQVALASYVHLFQRARYGIIVPLFVSLLSDKYLATHLVVLTLIQDVCISHDVKRVLVGSKYRNQSSRILVSPLSWLNPATHTKCILSVKHSRALFCMYMH